jgi:hypothetical protein
MEERLTIPHDPRRITLGVLALLLGLSLAAALLLFLARAY